SGSDAVEGSTISLDNLSFGGAASGIQEVQTSVGLRVYPTLATDVLNLIADQPLAEVDVLDLTGRNLISQATQAENLALNVSGLNTGRYLVQIRLADGRRLVRSFVKQ
ncbi:MAG: T9SS type A sorting domain-containing protein, partial [Flavobacteriales bacterium]